MPCQRLEDYATLLPEVIAADHAAENLVTANSEHNRNVPYVAEAAQAVEKGETEAQKPDSRLG